MSRIRLIQSVYRGNHKALSDSNKYLLNLKEERESIRGNLNDVNSAIIALNNLNTELNNSYSTYIDSLIRMIEESIAFAINKVLPFREYEVSLDYKPYRNNGRLKLFLIDKKGRALPPKIIEGDMLNQVLSFAAILHITLQKGFTTIYYDEAFASANIRSLTLINMLITYYVSQGVQFVFVTQNPALYAGLERGMVELVSDGKSITGVNKTKVEIDPSEFDTVARITELFDNLTRRN